MLLCEIEDEIKRRKEEYLWKYKPFDQQKAFHSIHTPVKMFIGGNQSGKTTAGLSEDIMIALCEHPVIKLKPPFTVWIVGLDRVNMLEGLIIPEFERMMPPRYIAHTDNKNHTYKLTNGVNVVFKSCDSGANKFQGKPVQYIHFDEEPPEDVYRECSARQLACGGYMSFTMTPTNGMSWSYYELYKKWIDDTDNGFVKVIEVNTRDNPFHDEARLGVLAENWDEQTKSMRLEGKYIQLGSRKVFSTRSLEDVGRTVKEPIFRGEIFKDPSGRMIFMPDDNGFAMGWKDMKPNGQYVMGVDTSEGINDSTAIEICEINGDSLEQVLEYNKIIPLELISTLLNDIGRYYNNAFMTIERNASGLSAIKDLMYVYPNLYLRQNEKGNLKDAFLTTDFGWQTNKYSKVMLISTFRKMLLSKQIIIHSDELYNEMCLFTEHKDGSTGAQAGGHDDRVLAMMLLVSGFQSDQVRTFDDITTPRNKESSIRNNREGDSLKNWLQH
jgi:phage terminase large subunit-like protein